MSYDRKRGPGGSSSVPSGRTEGPVPGRGESSASLSAPKKPKPSAFTVQRMASEAADTSVHEIADRGMQQRAGVQLKGNVGEVGDPYERHADAVADTVVAGKSAESLLSGMNAGPAADTTAVQFMSTPPDRTPHAGEHDSGAAPASTHEPDATADIHHPALAGVVVNETIREVLVKRPDVLKSLLKHSEAIAIIERALSRIGTSDALTPVEAKDLTTPLSESQRQLSEQLSASVPPGDPVQPGFDVSKIGDTTYTTEYLEQLYEQAEVAQQELMGIAKDIAAQSGGKANWRTEPKRMSRVWDKINDSYDGDASRIKDLAGANVIYQTLDELYRGLEIVQSRLGNRILSFRDRFIRPMESGYRDIQIFAKMSNGHIAEFRLHLQGIEAVAAVEHPVYEVRRAIASVAQEADRSRASPNERAVEDALVAEVQKLYNDALTKEAGRHGK